MLHTVILGLGSNEGDSKSTLKNAYNILQSEIGKTVSISSFYTTQPWGNLNQPDFINSVIVLETAHCAKKCLLIIQNIEKKLGRIRTQKWGKRILDIDILFYDDLILKNHNLTIPHPQIENRKFVLQPLVEICSNFIHPVLKKSLYELLIICKDNSRVKIETQL